MSAILSANDLNDFITPSVACIVPVETLPRAPPPPTDPSLESEVILDGSHAHQADGNAPPAQISLTDCLACSGCVTSAEAVLISLQSHAEVLQTLDSGPALRVLGPDAAGKYTVEGLEDETRKLFVASISPQTRASLAATCGRGVTEEQAGNMLERLLTSPEGLAAGGMFGNGFTWAVDTNAARDASLVLGAEEVLSPTSVSPSKPILTASCPGWVCYVEKTHPYVIPHLSKVKSPQALTGTLLKTSLSKTLGIPPSRIWHLAIMPCFDKKLEASREELTDAYWEGSATGTGSRGVRDVDCVITSKEVFMLTQSRNLDFFAMSKTPVSQHSAQFPDPKLRKFLFERSGPRPPAAAGSSGGNLYYVLQEVLSLNPNSTLQAIRGRNADVVEYVVASSTGQPLFKAARYYGFRNIQNLVRKLKPAKPSRMPGGRPVGSARKLATKSADLDVSYIEVMACPGGCTNGGGQVKVDDQVVIDRSGTTTKPGLQEQKDWLAVVDEAYFSADDSESASPGADSNSAPTVGVFSSAVRDTLQHWSFVTGIDIDRLAYTSFREVISDVGKPATDTERVVQLASKIGGGW